MLAKSSEQRRRKTKPSPSILGRRIEPMPTICVLVNSTLRRMRSATTPHDRVGWFNCDKSFDLVSLGPTASCFARRRLCDVVLLCVLPFPAISKHPQVRTELLAATDPCVHRISNSNPSIACHAYVRSIGCLHTRLGEGSRSCPFETMKSDPFRT